MNIQVQAIIIIIYIIIMIIIIVVTLISCQVMSKEDMLQLCDRVKTIVKYM